ncbi:MAG: toxin [Tannerellaceae bacterium]
MSKTTQQDVASFLSTFITKSKTIGIVFRGDRLKNQQTLADLEINALQRTEEVLSLLVENYSSGPVKDTLNRGEDLWVFGKKVKGREIYIKITVGNYGDKTFCISFHVAEFKMSYPFAEK